MREFESKAAMRDALHNISYVDLLAELIERGAIKKLERQMVVPADMITRYAGAQHQSSRDIPGLGTNPVIQSAAAEAVQGFGAMMLNVRALEIELEDDPAPDLKQQPGSVVVKTGAFVIDRDYEEGSAL